MDKKRIAPFELSKDVYTKFQKIIAKTSVDMNTNISVREMIEILIEDKYNTEVSGTIKW